MRRVIVVTVLLLAVAVQVSAGDPAPFTKEAYRQIEAVGKKRTMERRANRSPSETAQGIVAYWRAMFAEAGYDLDETIVQTVDAIRSHRETLPKDPESVFTLTIMCVQQVVTSCKGQPRECLPSFSPAATEAMSWLTQNQYL